MPFSPLTLTLSPKGRGNITLIEPKDSPFSHVGEDSGGEVQGVHPILPFPHHKGEGDEIRNNQVNTRNRC